MSINSNEDPGVNTVESSSEGEESDKQPIVIQNSSYQMKAGFAGDDAPLCVFPSVIARQTCPHVHVGMGFKACYVGYQAVQKQQFYCYSGIQPIQKGIIEDWDGIEAIWRYIFDEELRVSPEKHEILMTHSSLTTKKEKKKMMEIMFETFNVKYYSISQESLALYSQGIINTVYSIRIHTILFIAKIEPIPNYHN